MIAITSLALKIPDSVKNYLCRLLSPEILPNICLVIAGIVGIVIAIKTLKKIERQTKATEKAADAAKASTDALIASERGLLKVDLIREASKFSGHWYKTEPYQVTLTDEEIRDGFYYRYKLRVTNIGRTPVQLVGLEHRYSCLAKGVTELPPGGIVLAIADDRTIPAGETANIGFLKIDEQMVSHRKEIDSLDRTAVFHGRVKYFAFIEPSEESAADYCYVYVPSHEVLARSNEYNPNRRGQN